MLFHSTTTLLLLTCARVRGRGGYSEEFVEKYKKQINWNFEKIQPEVDTSCYLDHSNKLPNLYVICPTEVDCYVKPEFSLHYSVKSYGSSKITSQDVCEPLVGQPLSAKKKSQLYGVLNLFGVTNKSACAFSSIETLTAYDSVFHEYLKLNRANCYRECPPYNLTEMTLGYFNIGHLSDNTFCQFGQLDFLELSNCNISSIDEDAFVHLVNLNTLSLSNNNLIYLPDNLFRNNVRLFYLDLSDNQLQTFSLNSLKMVQSLFSLLISDNSIDFSTDHVTFPPNLGVLDNSSNKLRRLKLELVNLSELRDLKMNNNSIMEVDENAFQDLLKVENIDLSRNEIERLSEDTFKHNLKLEWLDLKENKLSEFPPIGHLIHLRDLKLMNNKISSINRTDLVNCTQLTGLYLAYNQLLFIEEGSFRNVGKLIFLYLDYNRLSKLPADFKSLKILKLYVSNNNFTSFSFEMVPRFAARVSFSHNQIETIKAFNFKSEEWRLNKLDLSHNRIKTTENLTLPLSIQEIDLSDNQISQVISMDDLINMENIRLINRQRNNISSICSSSFSLFYSNPRIDYYLAGNPFQCNVELRWVKSHHNEYGLNFADKNDILCQSMWPHDQGKYVHLFNLSDDRFLSQSDHVNSDRCLCPPKEDMKCQLPCPYNCSCLSDYDLETIYLMCNNKEFEHIPIDLIHVNEYKNANDMRLDFGRNLISHVNLLDFGVLNEIIISLRLANCRITSIDSKAFDYLSQLENLNLKNNKLEALPDGLFHQLKQLITLDLSNNQLTRLEDDAFGYLVNLRYLYLNNNSLNHLQLSQIVQLNSLENITLYNNPWSCDCAFIGSFKQFLINSPKKVDNNIPLNCAEGGQQFAISTFNMDHCSNQIHLTILIATITISLVLIIIAGLVFKWRYELQVLFYSRYGLRMFHRRQPEEEKEGKQFDAFMAYNSKDEDFLVEQLLPGLEKIENPYRILIHERDFLAGGYISENILEAIKVSSRTIIVLTENFVKSGWCRLEFKTAHVQMLEDRCPRLLVIVVGDVPETLDPEMQLYLKTNTYLKWNERLFWQKLYYAMPDRRVTTPPTDVIPMRKL